MRCNIVYNIVYNVYTNIWMDHLSRNFKHTVQLEYVDMIEVNIAV